MSDIVVNCVIGFVVGWFGNQMFVFIKRKMKVETKK
jgi:capsular polysaccharide biosynthesis protein